MSLINKMLQDLDKRGAAAQRAEGKIGEIEAVRKEPEKAPGAKIAGAAIALVSLGAVGWYFFGTTSETSPPVASAPKPVQMAQTTPKPAAAKAPEAPSQAPMPATVTDAAVPRTEPQTATVSASSSSKGSEPAAPAAQTASEPAKAEPSPKAMPEKPGKATPAAQRAAAPEQAPVSPATAPAQPIGPAPAKLASPSDRAAPTVEPKVEPPKPATRMAAAPKTPDKPAPKASSKPAESKVAQAAEQPPKELAITPSKGPPSATVATREAGKGAISVDRQRREYSAAERAATEYRNAIEQLNQGRVDQAISTLAGAVALDPKNVPARQALVALLIEKGRSPEAQAVLREGTSAVPDNSDWPMLLARLQVEAGDGAAALATLEQALPYGKSRPDYHAFLGTVLQLQSRHKDAIVHYEIAVRLAPGSGRWLTGLAISLEEEKRLPEARDAYRRALATNSLSGELKAFAEGKVKQLQ